MPAWLDTDRPDVTVVSHREMFGDTGLLPTFNSQAIESRLHRIPGLAEHFLYLNDDVFLGRPVAPTMFFTPGGLTRFFPSSALVDSAPRTPGRPAGELGRQEQPAAHPGDLRPGADPQDDAHPAPVAAQRASPRSSSASPSTSRPPPSTSSGTRTTSRCSSSLQQYYAYLTGRAAPGEIRYMYTDLADAGHAVPAGPAAAATGTWTSSA